MFGGLEIKGLQQGRQARGICICSRTRIGGVIGVKLPDRSSRGTTEAPSAAQYFSSLFHF
jgi:hypothetical protein